MVEIIRKEWAGANEQERLAMRQAAQILSIQSTMIDGVAELNNLLEKEAVLRGRANAGDLDAAAELDDVAQRIARVNSGLGVLTQDQIQAAEKYSESAQLLSQASTDLKNAFTTSFADDFAAAARVATGFVLKASKLWDDISGESDKEPPKWYEGYAYRKARDLLSPALSDAGRPSPSTTTTIAEGYTASTTPRGGSIAPAVTEGVGAGTGITSGSMGRGRDLAALIAARKAGVEEYAQGGIVPGPMGRPQIAVVHGGERVVPTRDRPAYDQAAMHLSRQNDPNDQALRAITDRSVQNFDQRQQSMDRSVQNFDQRQQSMDRSVQNFDQRQQSMDRSRVVQMTNNFDMRGISSPQEAGEEVEAVLRRALARGVAW